ncbi:hypothetical protein K1T71_012605 [Dendrolimus kikuchii]|uniref:Uncharacterized protein n=1 Tax=Dendrolimus kikuchii TaxID=765133 RepID=A0ACC1CJV5_9NEOP|nr:hypothetical protein K1T71_012605 [Dendrolimus kikuchii]
MERVRFVITVFLGISIFFVASKPWTVRPEFWFDDFYRLKSNDVPDLDSFDVRNNCNICPRVYLPVCGDDNKTYMSECKLKCMNVNKFALEKDTEVKMVRTGPCEVFPS